LGASAGDNAEDASYSNFFGWNSGQNATDAEHSNFFGVNSGQNATDASYSNFFGSNAGSGATSATNSNFIGQKAGWNAGVASYSNIFGFHAGYTYTGNDIGSNNIIIGTNISLPNATANAINIGGVLFGTGTYIDTDASHNPSITAQTAGKIGIARIPTTYTLEVGNSSVSGIVARFINSAGTCDINPTSASLSCSSDRTLKKNITTLDSGRDASDILNKVLSLRPVTYNWNSEKENATAHIGFIAQDVQEIFPDLVSQDEQTQLLSLNYMGLIPYTVRALQEMHIQMQQLPTFSDQSLMQKVADFLRGIAENATAIVDAIQTKRVQTDQLCVGSVCITEQQFLELLHQQPTGSSGGAPVIDDTTHDEDTANTEGDETTPPSTEDASSESTPDESSDSTETQTTPSDPITEPQTTNSTVTEPIETKKIDSAASEPSTSAESSDSNSKGESSSEVPSTVAQ
jgi:hypothetical protein